MADKKTDEPVKLITKTAFAKLAGVTHGAISQVLDTQLRGSVIDKKINLHHAGAQLYLKKKGVTEEKLRGAIADGLEIKTDLFKNITEKELKPVVPEELANLTLEQIVDKYGSLPDFQIYLKAQNELASYRNKTIGYESKRNKLIDKDFEGKIIFEILEQLCERLINDIPIAVTQRVISIVKRDSDDVEYLAQTAYVEANSRAIKRSKDEILRRLASVS